MPGFFQIILRCVLATALVIASAAHASQVKFKRIPLQFIAAKDSPSATSGRGAQHWGYWDVDPGPRGNKLADFNKLVANNGVADAGWQFDHGDWWLEENGLIMEKPTFPLPPGRYLVTGDRSVVTMLTIHEDDENGDRRWELDQGANLFDVTHLACRSARYTPETKDANCTPALAPQSRFPIQLNEAMPAVNGCKKEDYAVLFLIGVEAKDEP